MSKHLLQSVIVFFFFFVVVSIVLVVTEKAVRLWRERTKSRRRQIFQQSLVAFLCGDASALQPLKAKRSLDRKMIVTSLIETAENFDGEFRPRIRLACEELGFVQDHLRRITSWRWWVRAEAAYRLGLMGSPLAVASLIAALEDPIPEVRLMAIRSLAALEGEQALRPILQHFQDNSSWGALEISDMVLRLGPVCVPVLLDTLNGPWPKAEFVTVDLLGLLKDNRAVPALLLRLDSPDKELRIRAVKALGWITDPAILPAMCRRVNDPAWEVRLMIGAALGRAGGPTHLPILNQLLNDPEKRVRIQAAEALRRLGHSAAA